MPVYNLAPLWGPNMFIVDAHISQGFGETREETDVCADLISNYPYLFDVDMEVTYYIKSWRILFFSCLNNPNKHLKKITLKMMLRMGPLFSEFDRKIKLVVQLI